MILDVNAIGFTRLPDLEHHICCRVRETNPYLLLDEDAGGPDNDFSSQEVRTELGVLSSSSEKPFDETEGVNHNYSLGDEEDEQDVARGKSRLMHSSRPKSNID